MIDKSIFTCRKSANQILKNRFFKVLAFIFILSVPVKADECLTWFEKEGIKRGEDCLLDCAMIETDMGTFHCPEQCDILCRKQLKTQLYLAFSKVYPTLTQTEKNLVAKYPKKTWTAYKVRWKAEHLCLDIFEDSGLNDESDACRHFVWAILLYQNLGFDLSQKILNAHEDNTRQPIEQKSMDIANNQLGLNTAIDLKEKNKLNEKEILKAFHKNLKQGNFIVLKPGAKKATSNKILDKFKKKEYKKIKRR